MLNAAAAALDRGEVARHVDLLHEAVAEDDAVEALADRAISTPLVRRDMRHFLDLDGQDDDALVQHLVVLELWSSAEGMASRRRGQEDRRCRARGAATSRSI